MERNRWLSAIDDIDPGTFEHKKAIMATHQVIQVVDNVHLLNRLSDDALADIRETIVKHLGREEK
jgi:hypothetical protein